MEPQLFLLLRKLLAELDSADTLSSGLVFQEVLDRYVNGIDNLFDRLLVRRGWQITGQALTAARKGNLAISEQLVAEAARLQCSEMLSEQLIRFQVLAVQSYIEFRRNRMSGALELIAQGHRLCRTLESKGLELLHLHRIQLIHNEARINTSQGAMGDAANLLMQAVDYVSQLRIAVDRHGPWAVELLPSIPQVLLQKMANQLAGEIACCIVWFAQRGDVGGISKVGNWCLNKTSTLAASEADVLQLCCRFARGENASDELAELLVTRRIPRAPVLVCALTYLLCRHTPPCSQTLGMLRTLKTHKFLPFILRSELTKEICDDCCCTSNCA